MLSSPLRFLFLSNSSTFNITYRHRKVQHQVKAKILSAIFVRQIGHSEHAREQDLHTAKDNAKSIKTDRLEMKMFRVFYFIVFLIFKVIYGENSQQK